MDPIILFRRSQDVDPDEIEIAKQYFDVFEYRSVVPWDRLVIPRYSSLPYYNELEFDVEVNHGRLINSYSQHQWIANFEYYELLEEFTFKTWTDDDIWRAPSDVPFVVKGKTNSRKFQWSKLMYAKDRREALNIGAELRQDGLIGPQGVIYREYVPLKTYEIGISGTPVTDEWRFFFLGDSLLAHGYYWSNASTIPEKIDRNGIDLAQKVANLASRFVNFFVVDVAQTENGDWVLVELNCGTMSGLSEIKPQELYQNLASKVKDFNSGY